MVTKDQVQAFLDIVDEKNLNQGFEIWENDKVTSLSLEQDEIYAEVHDNKKVYDALIQFSGDMYSLCSRCEGLNCRHGVAAALEALELLESKKPKETPQEQFKDYVVQQWVKGFSYRETPMKPKKEEPRSLILILRSSLHDSDQYLTPAAAKMKKNKGVAKVGMVELPPNGWGNLKQKEARDSLSKEDRRLYIEFMMQAQDYTSYGASVNFSGSVDLLKKFVQLGICYRKDDWDFPLVWGKPLQGKLQWKVFPEKQGQKLHIEARAGVSILSGFDRPLYLDSLHDEIGEFLIDTDLNSLRKIFFAPVVPNQDIEAFHRSLLPHIPALKELPPKPVVTKKVQGPPKVHVKLFKTPEIDLASTLTLSYDGYEFPYIPLNQNMKEEVVIGESEIVIIERHLSLERDIEAPLKRLGWGIAYAYCQPSNPVVYRFCKKDVDVIEMAYEVLTLHIPQLEKEGWKVTLDPTFPLQGVFESEEWYVETQPSGSSNDWLDVELGVLIEGTRVNLLPLLIKHAEDLNEKNKWEELENLPEGSMFPLITDEGKMIRVPFKRVLGILRHLLLEFSSAKNGSVRVSKWNEPYLAEIVEGETAARFRWMSSETLKGAAKREVIPIQPPCSLKCDLRPYQVEGLSWLQSLKKAGVSGVLADDMGLGKTVQTLAHLLIEKEQGQMKGPCLIVAPTSLMPNWQSEAARLAPSLKVVTLHGNERKQHFSKIQEADIVLSTYPLMMRDKETLLSHTFHQLILDEAQYIKNSKTQSYQVIQQIQAGSRLCLSGTPMENHLGELWSLFHFLMPGLLGDEKTFHRVFKKPIEKSGDKTLINSLGKRISPFFLRRTKKEVALELPEKTEIIQKIDFRSEQGDLYEAIRLRAQNKVMQHIREKGMDKSHIILLDALLKLRQVCCDPRLVKTDQAIEAGSAKLDWLRETLPQMIDEGRKILLFSQFTSMLDLIEEVLKEQNISFTRISGNTKDRETPVKSFQNSHVPLMLISLRAGGVGLNLTAADTIIHYDPWWNPAVESQATDRAHRIGQTKPIFVYKLIMTGSLEEKILTMQTRKKELVSALLDEEGSATAKLTLEDLEEIFAPLG